MALGNIKMWFGHAYLVFIKRFLDKLLCTKKYRPVAVRFCIGANTDSDFTLIYF